MVMIKFWWKNPPSVVTIRPRLATAASRESDCRQVWNVYYDDFDQFFLSSPSKYQFSTTGGVLWHNLIWRYIFFLLFLGDLKNEGSVLEWLLSSDNRELDDAIEAVNEKMLSKLLQTTPFMAVFFCKFSFWLYTKKKNPIFCSPDPTTNSKNSFWPIRQSYTLRPVNVATEGSTQVAPMCVSCVLPKKFGKIVWVSCQSSEFGILLWH